MIKNISNSVSRKFAEKGILEKNNVEICSYGLEIFISTMISVCMVLFISTFFTKPLEGIIYLLFYCSLRTYAGGYHADSEEKCYITSFAMVIISLFCIEMLNYKKEIGIILQTISLIIILF